MMSLSLMMCAYGHIRIKQTSHHIGYNTSLSVALHHFERQRDTSFTFYNIYVKLNLKDVFCLKENKLAELSMNFAVEIIALVKELKQQKKILNN